MATCLTKFHYRYKERNRFIFKCIALPINNGIQIAGHRRETPSGVPSFVIQGKDDMVFPNVLKDSKDCVLLDLRAALYITNKTSHVHTLHHIWISTWILLGFLFLTLAAIPLAGSKLLLFFLVMKIILFGLLNSNFD